MIRLLLFCSLLGLISSTVYLMLALRAARRFRGEFRDEPHNRHTWPFVTVLKPLHGMEPMLERNLESFFRQNYREFELIFGARHSEDPALKTVDALRRKYPRVRTTVVLSGEPEYPNAKVFALDKMLSAAAGSYLVITDSDVCVKADCLEQVVAPLLNPAVGVVTCLYRGVSAGGIWSTLEALGMSIEMTSGVLVAEMLEGMKFALGPTMATRKDILESIGGVAGLGSYCADDYVLGNLAYKSGKEVVLSHHFIDHVATNTSLRSSLMHQVRWMRSTRFSRRAGHIGTGLTYAVPFGLLGLFTASAMQSWRLGLALFAWAFLNRVLQAIAIGWRVIGDRKSLWLCWLYPARDLVGFFVWCASFAGNEITWRNERYRLIADGKMIRK
ncbi:MAG TPA: bacteriohopanetetrol glucosamine biosynthesis glycosyltransferase HpnI [Terriglobia bacterium]|nr:bacteriohopanetetrol glucosamine biosynthesis glycosyltransferase HpnI [Terriglobia bacterium]